MWAVTGVWFRTEILCCGKNEKADESMPGCIIITSCTLIHSIDNRGGCPLLLCDSKIYYGVKFYYVDPNFQKTRRFIKH